MTDPPRPLTPQQLEAARHLVRGASGAEAAAAANVRPETISRWRRDPAFISELRRLVELAEHGDTRARVEALTPKALDALTDALASTRAPLALRVEAAAALLAFAASIQRPPDA